MITRHFRPKTLLLAAAVVLLALTAATIWHILASPTRIAFVNYQAITLGQIAKVNDNNPHIRISELSPDDFDKAADYDIILVNGMGMRITDDQRQLLIKAAEEGTPVMTTAATNPQNEIVSVDSTDYKYLGQYLAGGRNNYRNLLLYVRRFIDGKRLFSPLPGDPRLPSSSLLYYPEADQDHTFGSVAEYDRFLNSQGLLDPDAPRVILTGQMGVADSLVAALQRSGIIVYPVSAMQSFISGGHADSVTASAVINMAHGRMGDMVVDYLKQNNIPLFSPLNVNRPHDEWADDKMGMSGGFLSQSIVTPEIDGAILPYSLFAHYEGADGLPVVAAIPDRLDSFVRTVSNYLSLRRKANRDKKIAIFYFKGAGQNALVAEGMEVAPSLFNLLVRLRSEGYAVTGLPADARELERMIDTNGRVFNGYALGAMNDFVRDNSPEIISRSDYDGWCAKSLPPTMRMDIDAVDGDFPGHGLRDDDGNLALARLRFGNIVLIPQTAAGLGDDDFRIVHGTDAAPPHNYVAAYLWARHGFGADALIHFGTHGSLEFTPRKQVALGSTDWPDRLIGTVPHFYIYSTSNVGEAMTAKRRAYAGIINYLTPPFIESDVRGVYRNLTDAITDYNRCSTHSDSLRAASLVRRYTLDLGIHRELRLDSTRTFTPDDILRVENFAEELANEKITAALYVLGTPYSADHIRSTVEAITVDPIAYGVQKLRGGDLRGHRDDAIRLVRSGAEIDDAAICRVAGITQAELDSARDIRRSSDKAIKNMKAALRHKDMKPTPSDTQHHHAPDNALTAEQMDFAISVGEVERALTKIGTYRASLAASPEAELSSVVNALAGGFIAPSSGGDPVLNPDILPTGRNMFAINAEETPSAVAWEKGKVLAESTLEMYRKTHGDSLPRKVSYTLWSGEFIETEGATIAQVLYMLGVEPVRDPFGRVTDLRLIPSSTLGRPRIDVVVQTSGQLRDIAASRLFLISRAVRMAAAADDGDFPNYVAEGVVESERCLVEKGVTPREARELSSARVFGGVNGNYGSGIQGMVEAGDRWTDVGEIASVYINNMGALYGSEQEWEKMATHAFEAALTRTDVVVQPRQSNTWGALSLDHVYEFMGGMNLAVRSVTGKEPEAYLSDYRNRNNARMQEVKEAIGVESRTTILNPAYLREKMRGGAGDAAAMADVVRNTYGWNVMKPDVIDNELWDGIYDAIVADRHGLGIKEHFCDVNPAALQEMTAVMLETARKGLWNASGAQIAELARVHTETVNKYGASCSGFVCDNAALRDYIASRSGASDAAQYRDNIASVRAENIASSDDGVVMRREELNATETSVSNIRGLYVAAAVIVAIGIIALIISRRRRQSEL